LINIYKVCYIKLISIQALPLTMKLVTIMEVKKFIYYQDEDMFIGWLEEFPDYKTQGETIDELKENLKDIYDDLTSGKISNVLHVGELRVA
jgi:predicted RNase H-like HicB family nuclease